MGTLLLIFAHPADALVAVGGTIAKYTRAGWSAELVCALGDKGSGKEFESSASRLGVRAVTFLDYDERSFARLPAGEAEEGVYKEMLRTIPAVVFTFDMSGMTNHPDHIRIARSTTFAFQKYAAEYERRFPESVQPKLYYACLPQRNALYLQKMGKLSKDAYGLPVRGIEDRAVTTVIDIKNFLNVKVSAIAAYQQKEYASPYLFQQEYFICRFDGTKEIFMGKFDRVSHGL